MIKCFRRIRYDLMEKNPTSAKATAGSKTAQYLKYALGEIMLVVIGILIALWINNWNQNRIQDIEEFKSLNFLKAEFEGNLQKLDKNRNLHKSRLNAINELLFADFSLTSLDEIDSLYKTSFYSWTYNPSFSSYNSIVSSGKMNKFSNDSLKIRMSELKDLVADYQEDEENLWNHSKDQFFEQEILNGKMLSEVKFNLRPRTSSELSTDKLIYIEVFSYPEFRNKLTIAILHLNLINDEGEVLRNELVELNKMIEENINRFNK